MIRKCRLRDFFGQGEGTLHSFCWYHWHLYVLSATLRILFHKLFFQLQLTVRVHTLYSRVPAPLPTPLSSFMVFDSSIFFFLEREWQREEVKCIFLVIQLSNVECFPFFHQSFDQLVRFSPSFFFPSLPSQKSKKTLRCPVMFYFS